MLHTLKNWSKWCAPIAALMVGCSQDSVESHGPRSVVDANETILARRGADGESLRFEMRPDVRVTADEVVRSRDLLGLSASDELRLLRASPEVEGDATRTYRLYRDGARIEGAALVLFVHDGFVVRGLGTLTANYESPEFALTEGAAWGAFTRNAPAAEERASSGAERVLVARSSATAASGYRSAYRFTYTTSGVLGSRTVTVDASTGAPIPEAHESFAFSSREPQIASMRRELEALRAREAALAPRTAAAEPSAMVPHTPDAHELGHTLLVAASESIYGARTVHASISKPIDEALREMFALSHAYYVASNGFSAEPSQFDWRAAGVAIAKDARGATALGRWYYLLAHGEPKSDRAPEVRGIGVADATLVVYHAMSTGELGATTDFDSFPSAVTESAIDLFGRSSPQATAVGGAFAGVGVTADNLIVGPVPPICIGPCPPQYVTFPGEGADVDPWQPYFMISPMPSTANLTEFQVSTSSQFTNDADLPYTYKTVACGAYNPITKRTYVSSACDAYQGRNIFLRPSTHYYWRWRTNPGSAASTWGGWSAPIPFTTATKQVSISGPGSTSTAVNAQYPWGVPFGWSDAVDGATGYELRVSEDCTLSGPKVAAGAATHPTDVMTLAINQPLALSMKMDLDNHKSYCWTVVPKGPLIGSSANPGDVAFGSAHNPPTYASFTTSGAKAHPTAPANGATTVAPWNEQFKWGSLASASGYQVDISAANTFASVLKCTIKTAGQTNCLGAKMKPNTQYFWRVRAQGPTDPRTNKPRLGDYNDNTVPAHPNPGLPDPPWTPQTALSFTTADGVVILQSPDNGGTADIDQPQLSFLDNGADSYTVELTSTAGQFEQTTGPHAGDPIAGVSYQYVVDGASACSDGVCTYDVPDALTLHKMYYWRVQGFAVGVAGAWSNYGNDWSFTAEHSPAACVSPCTGQVVDPWPVHLKFKRVAGAKKYHLTLTNFVPEQNADDGSIYPAWSNGMTLHKFPGFGAMYTFTEVVDAGAGGSDPTVYAFDQWVRGHNPLGSEGATQPASHQWNVVTEFTDGTMSSGFATPAFFNVHDDKSETITAGECPNASLEVLPGAHSYKMYACDFGPHDPSDHGGAAFDNPWEIDCKHYSVATQSVVAPGNVTTINVTWPPDVYVVISAAASPDDMNGHGGHNPGDPQGNNDGAQFDSSGGIGNGGVGETCYTN